MRSKICPRREAPIDPAVLALEDRRECRLVVVLLLGDYGSLLKTAQRLDQKLGADRG